MTVFLGFRVKPFIVVQENPTILQKYEEFILTNCEFGYNYKTSVENLMYEFNDWEKNQTDYNYNVLEERQFRSYINRHFLKTNMKIQTENGINECNGIWGLKLKNYDFILSNKHKSNSKKVVKIDIKTQNVIAEYDSIFMLCDLEKVSRRKIYDYIEMKIVFDDMYVYRLKE